MERRVFGFVAPWVRIQNGERFTAIAVAVTYASGVTVVTFGKSDHVESLGNYGQSQAVRHIAAGDRAIKEQVFAVDVIERTLDPKSLADLHLTDDCRGMLQGLFIEAMKLKERG